MEKMFKSIGDFARAHILLWTVGIFIITGVLAQWGSS